MRLVRTAFARVIFLSRISAVLFRCAIPGSRLETRELRAPSLPRAALLRVTVLRSAACVRALATLKWVLREVRFNRSNEWPPPLLVETTCALRASPPLADPCAALPFGAPHAVSANAKLPIHVKNTIRFMLLLPFSCNH